MSAIGPAIAAEARRWVGTPYRHQGRRIGVGCDCLGLVLGVWQAVPGKAPDAPKSYADDWAEAGGAEILRDGLRQNAREVSADEMRPGDILLFRWRPHLPAKHAGILVGPDRFVHAHQRLGSVEATLVRQWRQRLAGIFRIEA